MFGGVVDVWKDVEQAVESQQVEKPFDDAGCTGQDDRRVGFASQRRHGPEQGPDAGAVKERRSAEVDDEVAMAAGDLAFDRLSQRRCVGQVEFACYAHV